MGARTPDHLVKLIPKLTMKGMMMMIKKAIIPGIKK
jgi:hypothetical protein